MFENRCINKAGMSITDIQKTGKKTPIAKNFPVGVVYIIGLSILEQIYICI